MPTVADAVPSASSLSAAVAVPLPTTVAELRAALRRLPADARVESVALSGAELGPDAELTLTDLTGLRLTLTVPAKAAARGQLRRSLPARDAATEPRE